MFLDTGYVIALEAADDQHHDVAVRHWRARKLEQLAAAARDGSNLFLVDFLSEQLFCRHRRSDHQRARLRTH